MTFKLNNLKVKSFITKVDENKLAGGVRTDTGQNCGTNSPVDCGGVSYNINCVTENCEITIDCTTDC